MLFSYLIGVSDPLDQHKKERKRERKKETNKQTKKQRNIETKKGQKETRETIDREEQSE